MIRPTPAVPRLLRHALLVPAAIVALTLLPDRQAQACFTPELCLLSPLCCPRPCPVKDLPRRAKELVRGARNNTIEDEEVYEAQQLADLIERYGRPEARHTYARPCDRLPEIAIHPDQIITATTSPPPPEGHLRALALLNERTVADASDLALLLSGYLAAATERLATAREAAHQAKDVRDLLRRMTEIQTLINDIDLIERTAHAAVIRLQALPNAVTEPKTP